VTSAIDRVLLHRAHEDGFGNHNDQLSQAKGGKMTTLPDEQACSATYLRQMLAHRFPGQLRVFADAFAMGCLLHFQGERCVAYQLLHQVFDAVGSPLEKRYLASLLSRMTGNELRFANEIHPSPEVAELCKRAAKAPAREIAYER
jgi:hypothetical protein